MLSIMEAIEEFERAFMLERQLDGIAAAKQAGKYKGRQLNDKWIKFSLLPRRSSHVRKSQNKRKSA